MDNKTIISILKTTATLLELHGANPFQVKYYTNAALFLENLGQEFNTLSQADLAQLAITHQKPLQLIQHIQETNTLERYEQLLADTPAGLLDLLQLKGLGPKKVRALWKALGIDNLDALLEACQNNQVASLSGFGPKTQSTILESLAWKAKHEKFLLYATALPYAQALQTELEQHFPDALVALVGAIRRHMELIQTVDLLIGTTQIDTIKAWFNTYPAIAIDPKSSGPFAWRGKFIAHNLKLQVIFCTPDAFYKQLILQTGSSSHLALRTPNEQTLGELILKAGSCISEVDGYHQAGLPYIPPELREGLVETNWIQANTPPLIQMKDLKGVLHNHTTYSDGRHTVEEMARYCQAQGYQYIGITDHSQTASYAGGLQPHEIKAQHELIDQLNQQLAPFKIFKGIEIDILGDGSLDYPPDILASFDFTVASIHSNLNMDEQTATERLIKAISNPFTTILGHATGRLLLKRPGYAIDYAAVIDACAAHDVIIEINANPWRLDLDWRWVNMAVEKGVLLSINPDAHHHDEIHNMYYGVLMGRKGGLTSKHTFNALPKDAVEKHFNKRKQAALALINRKVH